MPNASRSRKVAKKAAPKVRKKLSEVLGGWGELKGSMLRGKYVLTDADRAAVLAAIDEPAGKARKEFDAWHKKQVATLSKKQQ